MNDPMTSVEIEDVLSSIRRLVSEDLRPVPPKAAASGLSARPVSDPVAKAPDEGKLLLTPALRVVSAPEPLPEPVDLAPEAPFIAVTGEDTAPMGAVVARIGAQVSDDWDTEPELHAARSESPIWEPELVEVDLETVEEAEVLEVTSAEEARMEEAWRDGAWAEDRPEAEAEPEAAMMAEDVPAPEPQPLVASDRHLEAELADLVEAEVLARIEADSAEDEAQAAPTAGLFAPGDSDDFDEEALREVVRDIIREELQGALGERITRNVRKLVRAEINRALASQALS